MESIVRLFPEVEGSVDVTHVARWRHGLPYLRPGAYQQIAAFNAGQDPAARIQFASDFLSAPGQNSAVISGARAASRLISLRAGA